MPMITVQNFRLHYRDQGTRHLPTVVLIHGLGCSLRYWNCVFTAPEFTPCRIIALDLPGFGLSEKPEQYDYHLSSQAEIALTFLNTLHIKEFSLVGHSMGGSIAILMALQQPERIKRLLVIEPNLKASDAHLSREIIQLQESVFISRYQAFQQSAIAMVNSWFVNVQQTDLDDYIDELLKTTPISMYRSASSLIETTSDDTLLSQFEQLTLPKHFFVGQESMNVRNIPESFIGSDIHTQIVPGVGHMMMVDNPALFNKTLASALL